LWYDVEFNEKVSTLSEVSLLFQKMRQTMSLRHN
jgi:hypothetical protein